jgi:hypothetical protein
MTDSKPNNMKPILVTTQHRGVFAGMVPATQDLTARTMRLENARMAIYWGTTKGVQQLANTGPTDKSRISAPSTIEALHDITAVFAITEGAWARWNKS